MPRPAYMAAHSPAGPAPTMITSYPSLAVSLIAPQFPVRPPQLQPRRFGITGKRSLELRAKPNRFDLDIGSLPARQLFERPPAHRRHPMAVPALLMEQRRRCLDQALPDARRGGVAVTNYRTPDGFQGLVGGPILAGVDRVHGEAADAEHVVTAHEQGRTMHRLARRPQPLRQTAHGVPHLPRPRAPDGRADGGLDAVGGTDPVGERDIPSAVGSRAVVRGPRLPRHGSDVDRAAGPPLARAGHEPLKHEVGHERRRHDVVLRLARRSGCGPAQQLSEIIVPLPRYEDAVRGLAQLQACPTGGGTIDDHDAPEVSLPPPPR